jgi:hypothetical protein
LNIVIPGRTKKERYCDNHNGMKDKAKEYNKTQTCKETKKKHKSTQKFKETSRKYQKTQKFKEYTKKYGKQSRCCKMCSLMTQNSMMRYHQGKAKGNGLKCKEAQKARQIIFKFMLRTQK